MDLILFEVGGHYDFEYVSLDLTLAATPRLRSQRLSRAEQARSRAAR